MVMHELEQIMLHIPGIRWIRITTLDGWAHPVYHFDTNPLRRDTLIAHDEDRVGPYTAATLSWSGRVASELMLGNTHFVVNSGQEATHFVLPIDDGAKWVISFAVNGQPAIDGIIQYFRERDFLAAIVPFLKEDF